MDQVKLLNVAHWYASYLKFEDCL